MTQGDSIAMFLYGVATLPLISSLKDTNKWNQFWSADDSCVAGSLNNVKEWYLCLSELGPLYGYFPEPRKSCVIVKEQSITLAQEIFESTGISVVTGGRLLGSYIGERAQALSFVLEKVRSWVSCLQDLISVTGSQPQASYHALVKSLQSEWTFLQRVVPDCGQLFEEIEQLIVDRFIPLLIASEVTASERALMALPVRFGGLDLKNPVKIASVSSKVSRDATCSLSC